MCSGHGQSEATSFKISVISACLGRYLRQYAKRLELADDYYIHADLNAGSGYNEMAGIIGSSRVFMNKAELYPNLAVQAWFVEKNRKRAAQLRSELRVTGHLFNHKRSFDIVCSDNKKVLANLPSDVARLTNPRRAYGSVISDPNGWSPRSGALDLDMARDVFAQLPNMMVLISFFWGMAKFSRSYCQSDRSSPAGAVPREKVTTRSVSDYLSLRRHWLISEAAGQWCYLCGTPEELGGWDRGNGWGLVPLKSDRGRLLLRHYDELSGSDEAA